MENQKLPRLTVKSMKEDTLSYFNLERGLPYTYVQIFKNPFKTVQKYLYVDRKIYFNPFRYVLFATAIYTIFIKLNVGFQAVYKDSAEMNKNNLSQVTEKVKIPFAEIIAFAQSKVEDYQNIIYLILIPIVSFITYKLLKTRNYNYAENLAIHSFIFGTTLWTSSIVLGLTSFFEFKFVIALLPIITYSLIVYFYKKIFDTTWLLSLATMIIVVTTTFLVSFIFTVPIIIYKISTFT